jgi:hypothetical protein
LIEQVGEGGFVLWFAGELLLGVGQNSLGGGEPTRARALALTALTIENLCFFGLLIGLLVLLSGSIIRAYGSW